MGLRGDSHRYLWVIEGQVVDIHKIEKGKLHMHWKMCWYRVVQQHKSFQVCLQCIILLVGHFSCYESPELTLIK
jgi:hypothetical protein